MLADKSTSELLELKEEVELNLARDKSFSADLQYWKNLLKKINIRVARNKIEEIFDDFVKNHHQAIEERIQELKSKAESNSS
mmetsp:Transcript_44773/g.43364  ORF Transcript_44773/g.43364 Transcript_44773/m.43364 type:complete len:82 (+) Transcript_44773:695-940(+)